MAAQSIHHLASRCSALASSRMKWRADVARHDDDGVFEIDRASLAVRDAAIVEHLQQHVENIVMRLFDFVEEHHRNTASAARLR